MGLSLPFFFSALNLFAHFSPCRRALVLFLIFFGAGRRGQLFAHPAQRFQLSNRLESFTSHGEGGIKHQ